jgi:hypothetical protein
MKHEREFDTSYFHNRHIQGVRLHHVADGDGVDGGKGQPGVAPAASPLLSLQSLDLYGVFCVSLSSPREIAKGGVYIVGFR